MADSSAAKVRLLVIASAVVAVLAMAFRLWPWYLQRAAQDVSIWWDPYCTGTDVDKRLDNTILVRPGSACTIRVTIANDSRLGAHVTYLLANLPDDYPGVVRRAEGTIRIPDPEAQSGNAEGVFGIDLDVPSHGSRTIDIKVTWTRALCTDPNDGWSLADWPVATVEIWGKSFSVAANQYFAVSRDETACPS